MNVNFPLIYMNHCTHAKFISIDDEEINYHHDVKEKRIAFINPFFTTDEIIRIREVKTKNNEAIINEIGNDILPYLKFFPGIGNIVNQMALRPKILE